MKPIRVTQKGEINRTFIVKDPKKIALYKMLEKQGNIVVNTRTKEINK